VLEILVRQDAKVLEPIEDDQVEFAQLDVEQLVDREGDQRQLVDRRRVLLVRRPEDGEVDQFDRRIGLEQVAPGALARIRLAGDQQHLEAVAHAVDREHRRVVGERQFLIGLLYLDLEHGLAAMHDVERHALRLADDGIDGGDLLAVAPDGDRSDALGRAAEVVDLEGDVDALADQAEGRRLRHHNAPVLARRVAGHGEMHRRGDAELARGRRYVVHLAVGHQHHAGQPFLRNVGQRLAHGVEQLRALLGIVAAALGLHHAQLEVLELLRGLAQLGDRRVGIGGAVLQALAGRAVHHRQRDVLLIGALLLDQRGVEQDRGQRRAGEQAQQRAARAAEQGVAHQRQEHDDEAGDQPPRQQRVEGDRIGVADHY
jgi:hypothetical protein